MTKTEREAYWRRHVDAALSHPESLAAYCRESELCYQSLLNWKRRLGAAPRGFIELRPTRAPESRPPLVAYLGELRLEFPANCPPEWTAAVLRSLAAAPRTVHGEPER